MKTLVLALLLSGCGTALPAPEDMLPPQVDAGRQDAAKADSGPDLAPAPADMTWVAPPGSAGAGSVCEVADDCTGVSPGTRYCGTDIYDPARSGFCLDATNEGGGNYHISWGLPTLPAQHGFTYCDMKDLPPYGRFFPETFLCGTFVVR